MIKIIIIIIIILRGRRQCWGDCLNGAENSRLCVGICERNHKSHPISNGNLQMNLLFNTSCNLLLETRYRNIWTTANKKNILVMLVNI
jgi:hypothetical protein